MKKLLCFLMLFLTVTTFAQSVPYLEVDAEEVIMYDKYKEEIVYEGNLNISVQFYESEVHLTVEDSVYILNYSKIETFEKFVTIGCYSQDGKSYLFHVSDDENYLETDDLMVYLWLKV